MAFKIAKFVEAAEFELTIKKLFGSSNFPTNGGPARTNAA